MKKYVVLIVVCSFFFTTLFAQRTGRRAAITPRPASVQKDTLSPKNIAQKSTTTILVTPKKIIDTASQKTATSNDYNTPVKSSQRNNYGFLKNPTQERKPLAYDFVSEDDAPFSIFIWRDIDAREKINLPFIYNSKSDGADQRFYSILLNAIKEDSVVAFSPEDDRFTTPLTYDQLMGKVTTISNQLDTTYATNLDDENVLDTVISFKRNIEAPAADSVYKFRIKEQWFFDKEASVLKVRIIGIAPLAPDQRAIDLAKKLKGKVNINEDNYYQPLFWIYYPDLRASLAKQFAYNPKNTGSRLTWDEIFEGRFFNSYIYKSSLNNPRDLPLSRLIKDPLQRLWEGERIKEHILNYEQDLWSY